MRTFLYRHDFPDGKIFTEHQIADAIHDGWVDDPSDAHTAEPQAPTPVKPQAPKRAVKP